MARKASKVSGVYEKYEGSNVWYVRYKVKGQTVRKAIGTRQQAIDYLTKVRYVRSTGDGVLPTTAKRPAKTFDELEKSGGVVTVGELCDDLLRYIKTHPDDYKDQRNPPYRIGLIKEAFGEMPAGSVRPPDIADWLDTMAEGRAPATINRLKATWSSIYRHGKERGKVSVNPARDVKQRRVSNGVIRYLKPEEETRIRAVLQKAVDECPAKNVQMRKRLMHRIYELDIALGTGMRKSEQYNLCGADVDLKHRIITARDTKNGETRHIPMILSVHAAFTALQQMRLPRKDRSVDRPNSASEDVVFGIGDNKKWWTETLRKARVKDLRWHDLRHTFCSRLAQKGVSLKVIQEAAGHKTIAMSARYAHLHKSHLAEAMSVLD